MHTYIHYITCMHYITYLHFCQNVSWDAIAGTYNSFTMYVSMYVCMYVCMDVCNACMHACMHVCMYPPTLLSGRACENDR